MFASGADGAAAVFLDGERTRLTVGWQRPLTTCVDGAVELPFIAHTDGLFDRAIEDWHDFFGLPNASREEVEPNLLNVFYQDPSGATVEVNQTQSALGDLRLSLLWSPDCGAVPNHEHSPVGLRILRVGLKLPTGRLQALTGSGEADLFADITTGTKKFHPRVQARATLGVLLAGQVDGFSLQREFAAYGTAALSYTLSPRLTAMGQLDWHTPMFDTGLTELGDVSAIFTAGLRWMRNTDQHLEFAVVEDIAPDTGADISLMLNWRRSLGARR